MVVGLLGVQREGKDEQQREAYTRQMGHLCYLHRRLALARYPILLSEAGEGALRLRREASTLFHQLAGKRIPDAWRVFPMKTYTKVLHMPD